MVEDVAQDIVNTIDMAKAIDGVTDALVAGFTDLNTALIAGTATIIGVAIVLFGIKFAPRFLKSLFRTISA